MGRDPSDNAFGFLSTPRCNQDENHFSWILAYLLNTNSLFRRSFVSRAIGTDITDDLEGFVTEYQHTSVISRPDLVMRFSVSGNRHLVFIETKVNLEPEIEQLDRHLAGLKAEA